MTLPIFVYGTLRDDLMRAAVLHGAAEGQGDTSPPRPAHLEGYCALQAADGPYPVLRRAPGARAEGLLLDANAAVNARLRAFEGAFGYTLAKVSVHIATGTIPAQVFLPPEGSEDTGAPWVLSAWQAADRDLALAYVTEQALLGFDPQAGTGVPSGVLRRAMARVAAQADPADQPHRSRFGPADVQDLAFDRRHAGFFTFDVISFRHRTFAGHLSQPVHREVLATGDAVSVLPWDPVTDQVLLIEQVRAGLIARGDPNPWNLEVIAGMCDRAEPPETTARREAVEEAGLHLGAMAKVSGYYPSPGVLTEFVTSYIGHADLAGYSAGLHGLDSEGEDIRTLILPFDAAMTALDAGSLRNAPLILSLLWLARMRDRLRDAWA